MEELRQELIKYLDRLPITSDNIGAIRRSCLMPWHSAWNKIVTDETAAREGKEPSEPSPVRLGYCTRCGKPFTETDNQVVGIGYMICQSCDT